jgi:tetratricopeptide (TPR) repeat protein
VRAEAARARELLGRAAGPEVVGPSVTGLYALGVLEREEGRHAEADRLFTLAAARLLEVPPADAGPVEPWVKFQRAQVLLRGRPAPGSEPLRAAGTLLRESLEHVRPDPEELRRVADALDGLDPERRRDILVRIAVEEVEDVGALVLLSADLLAAGAAERALTAAERALILSVRPDHRYQALRSQLRALCGQGRNDEALDVYERLREHCLERGLRRELARFVLGEGRECGLVLPRERLLVLTQLGRFDPEALPDAEVPGAAARRRATLVELVRLYLGSHEDEDLASAEELIHELRADDPTTAEELATRLAAQSTNRGVPVVPPPVPELTLHVRYRFGGEPCLAAVGGAERDREAFERFAARGGELGYRAQWVPAHYDDPARTLAEARTAIEGGCRGLLLLNANRRVVRETLVALARKHDVLLRRFDLHGAAGLAIHARLLLAQLVQRHALTGRS